MSYLVNLFAGFSGRINRKSWWLGFAIYLVLSLGGLFVLSPNYFNLDTATATAPTLPATIWDLLLVVPLTAVSVKRFNDRNWPYWLGFAIGALGAVFIVAEHMGFFLGDPGALTAAEHALLWPTFAVTLFALIDNGFLRGTPGPNRYGPDPREAPVMA